MIPDDYISCDGKPLPRQNWAALWARLFPDTVNREADDTDQEITE